MSSPLRTRYEAVPRRARTLKPTKDEFAEGECGRLRVKDCVSQLIGVALNENTSDFRSMKSGALLFEVGKGPDDALKYRESFAEDS